MEFKTGDRVHVTRLDGKKVDFYATIGGLYQHGELMELVNCTDKSFKGVGVYLSNNEDFGTDKNDYYTLATDEEYNDLNIAKNMKEGCTMPTIKTNKEMNLPELIEWGWKNIDKVQSEIFISNVSDFFGNYSTVQFSVDGYGVKTDGVSHKDTFTVEVEEEITEDTEIPEMLILDNDGSTRVRKNHCTSYYNSIDTKALYMINSDMTMTLIWTKEKGMVE